MKQRMWYLILFASITLAGCRPDVHVEDTTNSPSGKYVATFYSASGGGAAGFIDFRIAIRGIQEPFQPHGDEYVFRMRDQYRVQLKWTDDTHLLVEYPSKANIEHRLERKGEVSVTYIAQPDLNKPWD